MNTERKEMRSAYNRAGLSVVALYQIFQTIGTLFLGLGVIPVVISVLQGLGGTSFDTGEVLRMYQSGELFTRVASDPLILVTILMYIAGAVIGMLVGFFVMKAILRKPTAKIEKHPLDAKTFGIYALISFGVWGIAALFGNLPSLFGLGDDTVQRIFDALGMRYLPLLLDVITRAPILEELCFRKALCDRLHVYGEVPAAVISALAFALMHGNSGQFFLAFALGLVFAAVYMKSGNIFYTIGLHFMINFFASLPEFFALFGINIDIAWTVIAVVLSLAGLALLVYVLLKKRDLLTLSMPKLGAANRQIVKNPGILIMSIGGLVLCGIKDLSQMLVNLMNGAGPKALVQLLPTTVMIAGSIILLNKLCKKGNPDDLSLVSDSPEPVQVDTLVTEEIPTEVISSEAEVTEAEPAETETGMPE